MPPRPSSASSGSSGAMSPLDCNYLDAQRIFMGCSDRGEYLERRGVAIACCGLAAQELNLGFLKPPYDGVEATASFVRSYFAERKLPFRLTFRGADRERCIPPLAAAGWREQGDPTPGMTLALPAAPPPPPSGLAVREVSTPEELVGFREAAFRGFGLPVGVARLFLNERLHALPQVRLFAGLVGGATVATSMLVATGEVAGIYWVATLPEQRGRGYGEALTWAAAAAGQRLGCRIASLQASKMGRPVYARMGFAHVLDYAHLHAAEV
jgi:GNAT superfamily N-acetyltransferase